MLVSDWLQITRLGCVAAADSKLSSINLDFEVILMYSSNLMATINY